MPYNTACYNPSWKHPDAYLWHKADPRGDTWSITTWNPEARFPSSVIDAGQEYSYSNLTSPLYSSIFLTQWALTGSLTHPRSIRFKSHTLPLTLPCPLGDDATQHANLLIHMRKPFMGVYLYIPRCANRYSQRSNEVPPTHFSNEAIVARPRNPFWSQTGSPLWAQLSLPQGRL